MRKRPVLSQRQMEVWALAARGCSNREIAERLQISENRVKHALRRVHAAVGETSREAITDEFRRLLQQYDAAHPRRMRPASRS